MAHNIGGPKLPGSVVMSAGANYSSGPRIRMDDALNQLAKVDDRKSQVVTMRIFGRLSVEETEEVLKVSPETVARD